MTQTHKRNRRGKCTKTQRYTEKHTDRHTDMGHEHKGTVLEKSSTGINHVISFVSCMHLLKCVNHTVSSVEVT